VVLIKKNLIDQSPKINQQLIFVVSRIDH